jgi:hypothetical protein
MKRRSGVVVGVVILLALIALWWLRREGGPTSPAPGHAAGRHAAASMTTGAPPSDPRTLARGSISGTVTDETKAPIARAQVCTAATGSTLPSAVTRALTCAFTDDTGRYTIRDLVAADYLVHASARQFRPGAHHPNPGAGSHDFPLAAGEARTGIDVKLKRGGAEITGVVVDVSGGPIAQAEVREATRGSAHAGAAVATDEQGRFALWADQGSVTIEAHADGYAPGSASGQAPGELEILLMPTSSLAGTVVDAATAQPVAGAQVDLEVAPGEADPEARDITDAQGAFRLEHLSPGRYTVVARAAHGYGRSAGSLLVGLGQHVDGAVIKLFPAHRVAGKVVIASSRQGCAARVELHDPVHDRTVTLRNLADGERVADGLLPGTYTPSVRCAGYVGRDRYDPIVVVDRDVTGLVWEVDDGARIRGKVLGKSGATLDDVALRAQSISTGRERTVSSFARSKADGSFELRGLKPGTQRLTATSDRGLAASGDVEITVAPAATVELDIVLEDAGKLIGSVVDDAGHAVPDVRVLIMGGDALFRGNSATPNAGGAFAFDGLRPGDYRVIAYSDLSRGVNDRKDTPVTVRAGQTATVKLTVEAQRGTITGAVVDAANQPVPDAFLSWARETETPGAPTSAVAYTREDWRITTRPVLTMADGSIQITRLAEGTYTLRAYRKGGGEAIAEHVAVGATATLRIKPTASIAGVARRPGGAPPRELHVMLENGTRLRRSESFYMTGGWFAITDLPAGRFDIAVEGDGSESTVTVDLRDGEARTGVEVELTPLVTVTGRLIEQRTRKPIPAYYITAKPPQGPRAMKQGILREGNENVTDAAGRFTLRGVPTGEIVLQGFPQDLESSDAVLDLRRVISGAGTVDIGDVALLKPRIKSGDPIGELGLRFEDPARGTSVEQFELKIKEIDPAGPAARTGLQVGDVITTCDGIDVTGHGATNWGTLVTALPGTRLTLGTRRGVTATLVLGRGTAVMP